MTPDPKFWLLGLALSLPGFVQAQSVKPGLWEYSSQVGSADPAVAQQMKEAQAQLAQLPPEQRKMMEQMLGQSGVGLGSKANSVRVCLTPEQAKSGDVPVSDEACTYKTVQRSASGMTMEFACKGEDKAQGTVAVRFKGDTSYDMKARILAQVDGKPTRMEVDTQARWVGASCGAVKPVR